MDLVLDTGFSHDGFEVIQQARSGVERGKAEEVAHAIGLIDKGLARILNLSERTLYRLRPNALIGQQFLRQATVNGSVNPSRLGRL